MVYAKNLLSFWQSGIWYVLGRGYLCDPSSIKTLGTESVMSSLVESISYLLSQSVAGGIKHLLCESTGRALLEACFLRTLPYTPFPFAYFTLHCWCHSLKHDYKLSPVSPSSKSLNLGWSWGTLTHLCFQTPEERVSYWQSTTWSLLWSGLWLPLHPHLLPLLHSLF